MNRIILSLTRGGELVSADFYIVVTIFLSTMILVFWRPKDIHEAWPASVGAIIILLTGIVSISDLYEVFGKIGGATTTIMATVVMAVILESFGFFHWVATRLATLCKGSGHRLYWYILLLCFLMTLLFNNDGSILITTPIIILLLKNLQIKPKDQIPYLLSGALIATASSAPIGVSNVVNLISLNTIEMTLYMHTAMMFVPATLGLLFMAWLMYIVVRSKLTARLPSLTYDMEETFFKQHFHQKKWKLIARDKSVLTKFMIKILLFVFLLRCMLFVASYLAFPIEVVAVIGSLLLLIWRWYHFRTSPLDVLKKTPWHIFIFAFSMYVVVYGLHNTGLTAILVQIFEPMVGEGLFQATFIMGGFLSILSNLFNNHPALMIGTMTLTEMNIEPITLEMIYLANIIGSDIGSLLLPIGTLASLIWISILRKNNISITWSDYLRVSLIVIPITVIVTLLFLFLWVNMIFV